MIIYRFGREVELGGNFRVGVVLGQQGQDFSLACGEAKGVFAG